MHPYRWQHLGYLPLFCEVCRKPQFREVSSVTKLVGRLKKTEIPFCTEAACTFCGLRQSIDLRQLGVSVLDQADDDARAALLRLFGEDHDECERLRAEDNLEAGLVGDGTRLNMMMWVYSMISHHATLPPKQRVKRLTLGARLGIAIIFFLLIFVWWGVFGYWQILGEYFWIVPATTLSLWLGWLVWGLWSDSVAALRERRLRRQALNLLVKGLAPLHPSGIELNDVHSIAVGNQWHASIYQPDEVLRKIVAEAATSDMEPAPPRTHTTVDGESSET